MHYMAWEISVFHAVNNWPNSLRPLFLVATVAPESIVIGLVAIVVAFFLKMYKLAWRLAVLTVGGFGVTFIVKHFFGRPRPQEVLTNLHVRASETGAGDFAVFAQKTSVDSVGYGDFDDCFAAVSWRSCTFGRYWRFCCWPWQRLFPPDFAYQIQNTSPFKLNSKTCCIFS